MFTALYGKIRPPPPLAKFHVGEKAWIVRKKDTFEKDFTPNWTEEVFALSEVKHTNPITYSVKDELGEPIKGIFYEQELQSSVQEIFRIERVLRKKKNQVYVKWKGYSNAFNSWIPVADLEAWISVSGMIGSQLETAVKTTLSFLKVCEDWLLERVDVEKLL